MSWWQKIFYPPYIRAIEEGTAIILKKFNTFPRVKQPLEITLTLTVRVIGDPSQFTYVPYQEAGKGVFGYALPDRIEIMGAEKDGKIIFEPSCLGHEFWHVLNMVTNGQVMNPDELQKER